MVRSLSFIPGSCEWLEEIYSYDPGSGEFSLRY